MRKNLLLLAFSILAFSISSFSQWVQTGGPEGGYAEKLIRSDNGHLVASTDFGGIFKSTDNGNSWYSSNIGLISDGKAFTKIISLKKGLSGKLYFHSTFANDKRAFVSTDNGNNWTMLTQQVFGAGLTTDTNNGTLYQVLNNELAKSTNNGVSWTFPTNTGLPKETIYDFVPVSNTELYVVFPDAKGIYKSTDSGNNWNKLTTQPLSLLNTRLFFNNEVLYCLSGTTIQISNDHGQTWKYTYNPPTFPLEPVDWAAADNGDIYVSCRLAGILKSTDKGATWNNFFNGLDITGLNLTIGTTQSNEVILCQYGFGLFKSPQAASGFKLSHAGFKASWIYHFFEGASGTFYTATNGSAYSSADKGKTWKRMIDFGLNHSSVCENGKYIFIGRNDGVMRSADGGSTWGYVKNGFVIGTQQYVHQLVVTSKGTILAATGGGMFRTTNNGDAWTKMTVFGSNTKVRSIIQWANGDLYASANYKLYKSVDDGVTWTQISLGKLVSPAYDLDGNIEVIDYIKDSKNNLYINFGGSFYIKSTDNGANWNKVNIPTIGDITNIKSIIFGQKDSLFVASNYHVVTTTDFGASHTEISTGLISRNLNGLVKTSGGSLLLLTSGSGLMKRGATITSVDKMASNTTIDGFSNIYPNPFGNAVNIEYRVEKAGQVVLKVYNILGIEVASLVNKYQNAGMYSTVFNTANARLNNGVYFCELNLSGQKSTRRIVYKGE
ncbi:MAG: T9SS type A sorting domain-containing protein [Prolixibacteraceae bacterium]|nr:T9SS type A sorting domain-containing protein [Prolixibacteraceae bacterium]